MSSLLVLEISLSVSVSSVDVTMKLDVNVLVSVEVEDIGSDVLVSFVDIINVEVEVEGVVVGAKEVEEEVVGAKEVEEVVVGAKKVEEVVAGAKEVEEAVVGAIEVEEVVIGAKEVEEVVVGSKEEEKVVVGSKEEVEKSVKWLSVMSDVAACVPVSFKLVEFVTWIVVLTLVLDADGIVDVIGSVGVVDLVVVTTTTASLWLEAVMPKPIARPIMVKIIVTSVTVRIIFALGVKKLSFNVVATFSSSDPFNSIFSSTALTLFVIFRCFMILKFFFWFFSQIILFFEIFIR